jgi:hypothetical protein
MPGHSSRNVSPKDDRYAADPPVSPARCVAVDGRPSSVYDRRKPGKASTMARILGPSAGYWLRALKAFVVLGGIFIAVGLAHWLYYLATR